MMSDEHSASSLKSWAIQELSDSAVDSPALDADILLSHVSGLTRTTHAGISRQKCGATGGG